MTNKDKVILDLCGGTGSWSKPYRDAGYDVRIITLPEYDVTKVEFDLYALAFIRQDLHYLDTETILYRNVYGILAAPPCTEFSIAKQSAPRDMRLGIETVNACINIVHHCLFDHFKLNGSGLKFWAMENPATGYLKRFLGKPALVFQPYEFGDPYTKKTALWGEFKEPEKNSVKPKYPDLKGARDFNTVVEHYEHLKEIPDGYLERTGLSKRTVLRSMTPDGFAKAFFEANQ